MDRRDGRRRRGRRGIAVASLALALLAPAASLVHGGEDAIRHRMEERALAHLAERLKLPAETIRVVKAEARTWPDERLGCVGRRPLGDPLPVAGYLFVLEAGEGRFEYHTDRDSRALPCDRPRKPVDRIE